MKNNPWVLFLVLSGAISCVSSQERKETLQEALAEFNRAMRWAKSEGITLHVPQNKREPYFNRLKEFGELKITDCEVGQVTLTTQEKALAMVRVDWYWINSGQLQSSFIEQTWHHQREKGWQIARQRVVRGPQFPLVMERR
jgi:hypothetical protein